MSEKILEQVEFYFGDGNLPRDKFLKSQMEQNNGWVPISVLLTFNRIKKLTTELSTLVEALKQSKELLEVSECGTLVKRKTELPSGDADSSSSRTLYVKGFPNEYTLDDLQQFFKDFKILVIRMRRNKEGFKGSIFVEFRTDEDAQKFAAEERKLGDQTLIVMKKDDYFNKKKEERDTKKKSKKSEKQEQKAESEPAKSEEFPKGRIVKITNLGEARREDLKEFFGKKHEIAYVDFSQGKDSGFIRYQTEAAAEIVEEFNKNPFEIAGKTPVLSALEGDEEKSYWEGIQSSKVQRNKKGGKRRGKGGDSNRNKRQRTKKGGDDNDDDDE